MTVERQKQSVESILGIPLPELDPIYLDGAKLYERTAPNSFITPYLLRELYTPREMRLVLELPGTSEEVAQKLGLDPVEVEAILNNLYKFGRLLPMKDKPGYAPSVDVMTVRDNIGMAFLAMHLDWKPYLKMFRLMDAWREFDYDPGMNVALSSTFRVIPKYESIKDLPGVMYCENIKEIIDSFQEAGKFTTLQCVCRAYRSYLNTGDYDPNYCTSGVHEHDALDGHCMQFGTNGDFAVKQYGAHYTDAESAAKCLKEIDQATAVLTAPNSRQISFICNCCSCCCAIVDYEKIGYQIRVPSRFRPTVRENKCVGCGICEMRCPFGAIQIKDGKTCVDADKCMGCGDCVVGCPNRALKMTIVHDVDWIPDIFEDYSNWNIPKNTRNYMDNMKK